MMLRTVKNSLMAAWVNARSWKTERKLVVFESDDWGCLRVRDKATFDALAKRGIGVRNSPYDRVDCLETDADLENLFNLLSEFSDWKANHPMFTMNTVMANPDFQKIKGDNFEKYHYKTLFDCYRDYSGRSLEHLWELGRTSGLIEPQFHGREHLNVGLWLSDLRAGHRDALFAFERQYFGLPTKTGSKFQKHYLAAFWAENEKQLPAMAASIVEGLSIFETVFGFRPLTMVPCNYVFPLEIEKAAFAAGIRMIQTQRGYTSPNPASGTFSIKRPVTGQVNSVGQFQSVRNVFFEPFEGDGDRAVDKALAQIRSSFAMKSPAIISTHRANYVGGLSPKNRADNSKRLRQLLVQMTKRWPQIEFQTSESLCRQLLAERRDKNIGFC